MLFKRLLCLFISASSISFAQRTTTTATTTARIFSTTSTLRLPNITIQNSPSSFTVSSSSASPPKNVGVSKYSARYAAQKYQQPAIVGSSVTGDSLFNVMINAETAIIFTLIVSGILLASCYIASFIYRRQLIVTAVKKIEVKNQKNSSSSTPSLVGTTTADFTRPASASNQMSRPQSMVIGQSTSMNPPQSKASGGGLQNTFDMMNTQGSFKIGNSGGNNTQTSFRNVGNNSNTQSFSRNNGTINNNFTNLNNTATFKNSQGITTMNTARYDITFNGQQDEEATAYGMPDQPGGDTLIEYVPVLSLPGFLQMEFSNDIRLKGKMAEGGGGVIYKADLLSLDFINRFGKSQVVVKVLKPLPNMAFSELKTIVFQEIAIMNSLSHHPNIIKLVGFTEEPLSIVTKLYDRNLFSTVMALPTYSKKGVEYEALRSFIKQDTSLGKGLIVKGLELLPEIAVHLAFGMASGMHEMHKYGILHRDLKSANVLIEYKRTEEANRPSWMNDPNLSSLSSKICGMFDQSSLAGGVGWGKDMAGKPFCPLNPVVCDFGLAKIIKKDMKEEDAAAAVKGMKEAQAVGISYRYAAPEAFNRMYHKGSLNDEGKPVDVYAFAIMVWEMLERKVPFHKIGNKEIETRVKAGERPLISPQFRDFSKPPNGNRLIPILVKLTESCWKQDPRARPSFEEVKNKLKPFWLGPKEVRDA